MQHRTARSITTLAIVCLAGAAAAQSASAPRAVGESFSTAARAQAKAASNSDVGTLVRTGPSAGHPAKHAAQYAEGAASSGTRHHVHRAHAAASATSN